MAVQIKNISKSFGEAEIFRNFSLDLPDSGCVCLFGPSGSGKTTLLNLILDLVPPDAGQIVLPPGEISVVFQEDRLFPWASARENVRIVLEKEMDFQKADARALSALKDMFLEDCASMRPSELSGGMRRRVSLARALAYGGSVLLLDEPFSGMDAQIKDALFPMLARIKKEKLVVLITHYPEEAVRLADTIHVLSGSPVRVTQTIRVTDALRENAAESLRLARALTALLPSDSQP